MFCVRRRAVGWLVSPGKSPASRQPYSQSDSHIITSGQKETPQKKTRVVCLQCVLSVYLYWCLMCSQTRVTRDAEFINTGRSGINMGLFETSSPVSIIPPLLHEVSDSPDQAAHYHTVGPKFSVSSLTWHLVGLRVKVLPFIQDDSEIGDSILETCSMQLPRTNVTEYSTITNLFNHGQTLTEYYHVSDRPFSISDVKQNTDAKEGCNMGCLSTRI
jgi:hypothetical protein